jgi:opacity protein-like surface antigen
MRFKLLPKDCPRSVLYGILEHRCEARTRFFLTWVLAFVALLWISPSLNAQVVSKIEASGGWAHVTGNFGLDGFNVGIAGWFNPRVAVAFDYDGVYDTSTVGIFQLSNVGQISSHSHLQDFLFGPRIYFPGLIKTTKLKAGKRLTPFAEAQFGLSHLHSSVSQVNVGAQSASDTAFSWMLGAGADYRLNPRWLARLKLDFLRTHFADQGQSRLRLCVEAAYTFGNR